MTEKTCPLEPAKRSRAVRVALAVAALLLLTGAAGTSCSSPEPDGGDLYRFDAKSGALQAHVRVQGNPCGVVATPEGVWVVGLADGHGGSGDASIIDAKHNAIVATRKFDAVACEGASTGSTIRLDGFSAYEATTGSPRESVKLPPDLRDSDTVAVDIAGQTLWRASNFALVRVDLGTLEHRLIRGIVDQVADVVAAPDGAFAVGDGWLYRIEDDRVVSRRRLDPPTYRTIDSVAYGFGSVWVGDRSGLLRLSPTDLGLERRYGLPRRTGDDPMVLGDRIWFSRAQAAGVSIGSGAIGSIHTLTGSSDSTSRRSRTISPTVTKRCLPSATSSRARPSVTAATGS